MKALNGKWSDMGAISVGVQKNGMIYASMIPIHPDHTYETGDMSKQADVTFRNLELLLEEAGGSLRDVVQVIVYLTDIGDIGKMNEVWEQHFREPYPNRATVAVSSLAVPGVRIEIVATAVLDGEDAE